MNEYLFFVSIALFSAPAFAFDCTKSAEKEALEIHREQLTEGTSLGQPKVVGHSSMMDAQASLGTKAEIYSVSVRDDVATEKWLVILDRTPRCRLLGIVHVDNRGR